MSDTDFFEWLWSIRNIRTPCARCHGLGCYLYGSTSTWRGGIGGAAMTRGVCDACWGSGDAARHGEDLRAWRAKQSAQVAARAATLFADRCGTSLRLLHPAIRTLCDELDKLARGRKERPYYFAPTCNVLAKVLRESMAAREEEAGKEVGE